MNDLKTLNRVRDKTLHELKPFTMKEGTVLERDVVRIVEKAVYVKSRDAPGEFIGNYVAWLDMSNMGQGFQKLIDSGDTITARIKLIKNRWEVLSFTVYEKEDETSTKKQFDLEQGDY